ncbi:unnamed protein product [Heligmosomoides polygyrus]|uniref:VPS13_mid_rpt domain-containing protein n=2 Tax=Heligmosomoides polygyrus TaxID=6339 RepID=A0A3P8FM74_HELPZ|nr:unnamed protein product [Heligmosomoides polygyrus]
MRVVGMKLSGSIKEDNSMNVAISLNSFTMSDERKSQTKIHQLLDKKKSKEGERFLALAFTQDAKQNKNIKLKMSAFFICLCPEFLGCLSRFFTVTKSEEQLALESDTLKAAKGRQEKGASVVSTGAKDETSAPTIVLDCDMQGVEVILVENAMQPDTSQALILAFNMKMQANPSPQQQVMNGGIEKLAIYSSYYAPNRRHEVTYEVLKPMNIGIEMCINTTTNATNVVLKMSPMEVRMAPSIIRLLSTVNAEFAKSSAGESGSGSSSSEAKLVSYPNYWRPRRIDQKKFWFFQVPTAEEACEEDLEDGGNAKAKTASIEHARVEIERMNFTLEAGTGTIPVPLIFMQMFIKAEAPAMDVKIDADDILNVTVTKTFITLLNQVSQTFAHAAKKITPPVTRYLPGLSAFLVLNETGIIIKVSGTDNLQVRGLLWSKLVMNSSIATSSAMIINQTGEAVEAPHGRFIDLHMSKETAAKAAESQDKERLSTTQTELSADLRVDLLDTVRQLKIGRADKVAVPLPKKSDAGKQWKIVVDTTIENGRRLVTFKPHVSVTNHLDVPMELYAKNGSNLDLFGTASPGETLQLAVPLLCEVSFESITWHQFTHNKRQTIRCDLSEDTTQGYFFETVVHEERIREGIDKHTEMYSVHLYPPLQLYNILPFPITLEIPVAKDLVPGESTLLNIIPGHRIRLWAPYLGEMYSLDMVIPEEKDDLEVVALNTDTGSAELVSIFRFRAFGIYIPWHKFLLEALVSLFIFPWVS